MIIVYYYIIILLICLIFSFPVIAMANNGSTKFVGAINSKCQAQCGNVTVPYPFGINGKGNDTSCSLGDAFSLTCDDTSFNTTRLLLGDGFNVIYNISDSELRIKSWVAFRCYNKDGNVDLRFDDWNRFKNDEFTFSEKNKLIVIGCDDYSLITGRTKKAETTESDFSSGCISSCVKKSDVAHDGKCSGKGCCLIPIANGLQNYELRLDSFQNHRNVSSFNPCGSAFLGEEGSFEFRGADDLLNFEDLKSRIRASVPVVLDWVIGTNRSCSEATEECKGNSHCYDVEGGGYRCRCNQGYEGNPYLDSGCQDIDECLDSKTYPCYGDCKNYNGGYNCTCRSGSLGDAKLPKGCQRVPPFRIIFILSDLQRSQRLDEEKDSPR